MTSVRSVQIDDDISHSDAVEISKDIRRMIRRARASKYSQMFIRKAVENLIPLLREQLENLEEAEFEDLRATAAQHREEALQAIRPFTGFFQANGLLPTDEVTPDAHLLFILVQVEQMGDLSPVQGG